MDSWATIQINYTIMSFVANQYEVVRNFLDIDFIEFIQDYFALKINSGYTNIDSPQVVGSYEWYSDHLTETLLQNCCEPLGELIGIKMLPTYSFTRCYMKGDPLLKHIDRPSCEISATVCLGYSNDADPPAIYFSPNEDESEATEIILNPGDLCLYRGCNLYHWRPPVDNKWLLQTFLHFVDSEGIHKDLIYDGRDYLGFPQLEK